MSVFEPSWPDDVFVPLLRDGFRGFDCPTLYWGDFRVAGTDPPVDYPVSLRLGPTTLPAAQVVQLSATVQYASHVVNLVIPRFGDARLPAGAQAFDQAKPARAFYEYCSDDYDSLALVPAAVHLASFRAFHVNVRTRATTSATSGDTTSTGPGSRG